MPGFSGGSTGKESACNAGDLGLIHREDPMERKWLPTPVLLPGKSHDRGARQATVHGVTRVGHNLATKSPPPPYK